jgi:hypothetical protein
MIAWIKFIGKRHLVAGIWDEGGWNKYGGRRQVALFGGLFGSKGVIGHISATGAASYPQSEAPGSQYARLRAIDGRGFENGVWVAAAMTFDPKRDEVTVYCNGVATPTQKTDPVARDVFQTKKSVPSNPFCFPWPIYSPRRFVLKFNGYDPSSSGYFEQWLRVDLDDGSFAYGSHAVDDGVESRPHRVVVDMQRDGESLLETPLVWETTSQSSARAPEYVRVVPGDIIVATLARMEGNGWEQVGTPLRRTVRRGAPFTFGRALGLGAEEIEHGSQLVLDGVAVFNRVLTAKELEELSFSR